MELIARGRDSPDLWFPPRWYHQLNPHEATRDLEAGKEAADAFREPAAVIPQMGKEA
jgi:hypothetical protein